MRIYREKRRETGDKTYITAELGIGDVLMIVGAFVIVVAAVAFGVLKIRG